MARLAARSGDLVLVTGATGRIGANLCRDLLGRGYRVRALALPGDPARAKLAGLELDVVEVDLRDAATTAAACAGVDAICHLAALMGPDAGEMPTVDYWRLNVEATLNVLEGARANGRLVKLLFASTDATYPAVNPRYSPIDESHPQDPVNLYGLTKVVGEGLCRDYLTEFDVPAAIVRFGGVASPEERAHGAGLRLSAQLRRFRESKVNHNNYLWITVRGHDEPWEYLEPHLQGGEDPFVALTDAEGRPWQSHPTDVRDAVAGALLALESPGAVGEAFNILGPAPLSSIEAARTLAERHGAPWTTIALPFRQAFEVSTAKARAVLGYHPRIDFARAVDDGLAMHAGDEVGVIPARASVAR